MIALPTGPMRGLSLWNPWGWALFRCGKDLENRPWNCAFRGWLAIQIAKRWDFDEIMRTMLVIDDAMKASNQPPLKAVDFDEMKKQCSHVIGLVRIDKWLPTHCFKSPWAYEEGYAAHIAEAVEIEPVPCKGKQGLFYLPLDVEPIVRERFASACTRGARPTGEANASDDDSFRLV